MNEKPFDKCPICGRSLLEKSVRKILSGGVNTAVPLVSAEVCQLLRRGCAGEREIGSS